MKPILVGEQNPYSGLAKDALLPYPRGAAGDRLRRHLALTDREYLRRFDRVDLVVGRAKRWNLAEARARAEELWNTGAPLVLLGSKVCRAFGLEFGPFEMPDKRVLILPHPSGRNPAWLEEGAPGRARDLVEDLVEAFAGVEAPEPEAPESPSAPDPGAVGPTDPEKEPDEAAGSPEPPSDVASLAPSPAAKRAAKRQAARKAAKKAPGGRKRGGRR